MQNHVLGGLSLSFFSSSNAYRTAQHTGIDGFIRAILTSHRAVVFALQMGAVRTIFYHKFHRFLQ